MVAKNLCRVSKPLTYVLAQARQFSSVTNIADAHLSGANAQFVDLMYQNWKRDPSSVHPTWDGYFRTGSYVTINNNNFVASSNIGASSPVVASGASAVADQTTTRVIDLVRSYQRHGHILASIDPLDIAKEREGARAELSLEFHGLSEADLSKSVNIGIYPHVKGFLEVGAGSMTIGQIFDLLKKTYSNTIGYEFDHVSNIEESNWLLSQIEVPEVSTPKEKQVRILQRLAWAWNFESFLKMKYNVKRFGLEGGETAIVGLRELVETSSDSGVESIIMGMPHRGRLNILANIVKKPLEAIFAEFAGFSDAGDAQVPVNGVFTESQDVFPAAGDVKYHHGWSTSYDLDNGKSMHVSMLPNPSHLEAVNPLVQGKARSKQELVGDNGSKIMSVILHGDAAFAGQGVVYEAMSMHGLKGFTVGGTVHLVINNQIGFTTDPISSRSGPYCTDLAKTFQAPVFHVNGDDAEGVARVFKMASEYRAKFHKDVVIDLVCYRLNGHNELDQPRFTQPTMYSKIEAHTDSYHQYQSKLVAAGVATQAEVDAIDTEVVDALKEKFEISRTYNTKASTTQSLQQQWSGIKGPLEPVTESPTCVSLETLKTIGTEIATIPEHIHLHRGINNAYKDKAKAVAEGKGLDWATAEALAFGASLKEGFPVRISGQDAERGTFSHRHAVVHDQNTNENYTPLNNISGEKAKFTVVNSLLSEYAVLGYEYGYSLDNPNQLVLWEAQFGDFVNGSQIIIDNFISGAEYKWGKQSNLVMLLPHGYEGQGAEHSSCRVERFLQSVNEDPNFFPESENLQMQRVNWQVLNMTSAANYFHALRRQIKRDFRKPLIVCSPKSLLRHKGAAATYEEMAEGTSFRPVIGASVADPVKVKRHVYCSGKVYFDLIKAIEEKELSDVIAVSRIEQIAPFPFHAVQAEGAKYPNADVVYAQEEHMNMGAWEFVKPRLETALKPVLGETFAVKYAGRSPAAAAATGSGKVHEAELKIFLDAVTSL